MQYFREKTLEPGCLDSNPGFALPALYDFEQITQSFCASVSSTGKWRWTGFAGLLRRLNEFKSRKTFVLCPTHRKHLIRVSSYFIFIITWPFHPSPRLSPLNFYTWYNRDHITQVLNYSQSCTVRCNFMCNQQEQEHFFCDRSWMSLNASWAVGSQGRWCVQGRAGLPSGTKSQGCQKTQSSKYVIF